MLISYLTERYISYNITIMLNIFSNKAKTNLVNSELDFFISRDISDPYNNNNNIGETRHYPPASKE